MNSGQYAESVAKQYLLDSGFRVTQKNWRTRWCEIDLIAQKDNVVYFCEVKYRQHVMQGSGLNYITPAKIRQMRFAAEIWLSSNGWEGECRLAAIEVAGPDFQVSAFIDDFEF